MTIFNTYCTVLFPNNIINNNYNDWSSALKCQNDKNTSKTGMTNGFFITIICSIYGRTIAQKKDFSSQLDLTPSFLNTTFDASVRYEIGQDLTMFGRALVLNYFMECAGCLGLEAGS